VFELKGGRRRRVARSRKHWYRELRLAGRVPLPLGAAGDGGRYWARTSDPCRVKTVLYH
jgi:hypothetical protein